MIRNQERPCIIGAAFAGADSCARWQSMIGITRTSSNAIATALATGQSRLLKNSVHSTLPIMSMPGSPSSEGMTNSPTAGMNTSMQPATMPGIDSGSVILRNAFHGRQPRSAAASSSVRSIFSRFEYSGRIMNGRYE